MPIQNVLIITTDQSVISMNEGSFDGFEGNTVFEMDRLSKTLQAGLARLMKRKAPAPPVAKKIAQADCSVGRDASESLFSDIIDRLREARSRTEFDVPDCDVVYYSVLSTVATCIEEAMRERRLGAHT